MKLTSVLLKPYSIPLTSGAIRKGAILEIEDSFGNKATADIAPLPQRSKESLEEALTQFHATVQTLKSADWHAETCLEALSSFNLLPSLSFAWESALFSLLKPLKQFSVPVSALIMGNSVNEIIAIAKAREKEGFKSAKLKVGNLSLEDAYSVIEQLKEIFKLRIDVNSSWDSQEAIQFFNQFRSDTFDYIEDPFSSLNDLIKLQHPFAIEEPLSKGITLSELKKLPQIKAIIYKPTIMGGMLKAKQLQSWAQELGCSLVLSSSFESDVGHYNLAAIAHRLQLPFPNGIGTYHYLGQHLLPNKILFSKGCAHLS